MDKDIAISINKLHKEFVLPQNRNTTLKQAFVNIGKKNTKKQQQALDNINFDIKKGEFFGIIGRNGSGKSTILKILAGVYVPTSGGVTIEGGLTPFIELGVGFNPELSGRDNVFLNGALLGFGRKEMMAMYDDIVKFAELERFMGQKLKNYSSGMQVRLAFSIAIRVKSDILLIDEVLAVGDENFQKKCMEVFEDLKRDGRTIVFVSHSMGYVREFCDRVAVIHNGKLMFTGDTEEGIDIYNKLNSDDENVRIEIENSKKDAVERFGNGQANIYEYKIFNHKMDEAVSLESGKEFTVKLSIVAKEDVKDCAVGVMFRKDPQENLYGLNNYYHGELIKVISKGSKIEISFKDKMILNPGSYYLSFSVAHMTNVGYDNFDNLNNVIRINVAGSKKFWGVINTQPKITVRDIDG